MILVNIVFSAHIERFQKINKIIYYLKDTFPVIQQSLNQTKNRNPKITKTTIYTSVTDQPEI